MTTPGAEQRYDRQTSIPGIGAAGQEKLRNATVMVAGLGGLGSILAYYMAAVGVGTLRIVDRDRVSISDLNRQILYETGDIGRPKTEAAALRLAALNPECRVEPFSQDIRKEEFLERVHGCRLILDGTDNPEARSALNRASLTLAIPFVHGGIDGFEGTVTTFLPGEGPCFRCLFPNPRQAKSPPGALGPVAGIVASIQCAEAVKMILGRGHPLVGRLLLIRAGEMRFREVATVQNPQCPFCTCKES